MSQTASVAWTSAFALLPPTQSGILLLHYQHEVLARHQSTSISVSSVHDTPQYSL